jgi:O-acetyl-ADP-ribose deacetylase (regulator of RNase III)
MIRTATGDLLKAEAEALVNPVNTVGVMGRGLALQFKRAFPDNFRAYAAACKAGQVVPGKMFIFETGWPTNPKLIVNFPTKRHWRDKSRLEDIEAGLAALLADAARLRIRSIAIPPIGCGLGGLPWQHVRPLIETTFALQPDVVVHLYPPGPAHPRPQAA